MKSLLLFELKKNRKTIFILSLVTGMMVMFSMLFYKTIAENMTVLSGFLSSGFMQSIMVAFNIDVFSMRTLNGFFSSYCTMWVVLMGSIFFAHFGSELLAKEEKMGTIEFLLSKPIMRKHIFISKLMTLVIACITFIIVVGVLGFVAISFQIKYAPYELDMQAYTNEIETLINTNSEALKPYVRFTEDDFKTFTTSLLTKQYTENRVALEASGIDAEHIMSVLESDMENPEVLFEKMMASPAEYMALLQINAVSEAEFVKGISDELVQYQSLKATFLEREAPLETLFGYDPSFFIQYWIDHKYIDEVNSILDNRLSQSKLISRFDTIIFLRLILNMFMIVLANGFLGFIIAAITQDAQVSSQKSMIIILMLYFVNSMGGISETTTGLKYFTTFGYIETDISTYHMIPYKPILLLVFMMSILLLSLKRYKNRNFN